MERKVLKIRRLDFPQLPILRIREDSVYKNREGRDYIKQDDTILYVEIVGVEV